MEDRNNKEAAFRGLRNKCPRCGKGPVLRNYLKVVDDCAHCGEHLSHARADDGPAYLTIVVVGHLLIPIMGHLYASYDPDPLTVALVFCVAAALLSLWMLPKFKGMIVGIQWANHMHGF